MSRAAPRLRRLAVAVVGLGLLPALAAFARASSSAPALVPDYMVERWTTADGLPLDHLTDLVFGEDGALWLASYDGLARFDGDRFTVMRRATDPRLPSNRFVSLAAERTQSGQGRVWAVTEDGDLVRVGDLIGSSRSAAADDLVVWPASTLPSPARALVTAGERLYALTARGLLDLTAAGPGARELALDAESPPSAELNSLAERADGVRFVGSEAQGVFRLRRGHPAERVIAPPSASRMLRVLGVDESGSVWAGGTGLYRIRGDQVEAIAGADSSGAMTGFVEPCDLVTRADGRVEVRDRRGWWRVDGDEAVLVLPAEAARCLPSAMAPPETRWPWRLAGQSVLRGDVAVFTAERPPSALTLGPDGSVWVATVGEGLVRIRPRLVNVVEPPAYWRRKSVDAVMVDRRGQVWAGSIIEGLALLEPSRAISFPMRRGDGQPPGVLGLVEQDQGVEVGTDVQLCVVRRESCEPIFDGRPGRAGKVLVPLLVERLARLTRTWYGGLDAWVDGEDAVWVREQDPDGERWREVSGPDGPIRDAVAATAGPDGAVFIATASAGLVRVRDDGTVGLGAGDGLSSEHLRSLYVDPQSVVWIGTEDAGLCRWRQTEARADCLGSAAGLVDDVVHAIVPDGAGRLWLSGNRGLSWVTVEALDAVLDGREPNVLAVGLGAPDGMTNPEGNGILPQSAARDGLGRLWFATQHGAAWVDPKQVPPITPPRVHLVALSVDGAPITPEPDNDAGHATTLAPDGTDPQAFLHTPRIRLGSEAGALELAWSASALDQADDVRFRHRMRTSASAAWSPPSRERRATWLSLPPGEVVLEIQAGLGGAWGEPLTLSVARAPAFRETLWFSLAIALGVGLAAVILIWLWARRQRSVRARLETEVARRTAELRAANQALGEEREEVTRQAARLAELNELRQRFVADLSHELRTPLTLVAGPIDDLAQRLDARLAPAERAQLEVARKNLARLEVLNDQLLDVARLEAGALPIRARRHELRAFAAAIIERFRPAFERKRLGLELAPPSPPGATAPLVLFFDGDLIDKVLSNLLANALKFTDLGGVTVTLEGPAPNDEGASSDGVVKITVRDTGIGIPPERHASLFDRFYQVERGDARRFEGVGIGLALVRDIVHLHGGEVGVRSAPGLGSAFWVTLPLGAYHLDLDEIDLSPQDGATAGVNEPDPTRGADEDDDRPEVLVVEDHPEMRAYLAQHLSERFRVVAVDGGPAALRQLAQRRPAAIVSDVMMPGMDGLELCRRLRADDALRGVPVVLVSAKASEADRVAGLAVADDYLTKPVRPRELLARIERLIDAARRSPLSEPVATGREGSTPGGEAPHAPVVSAQVAIRSPTEPVPSVRPADHPPTSPPPDEGPPEANPSASSLESDLEPDRELDLTQRPTDPASLRQLARIDEVIRAHLAEEAFGVIELAAALGTSRRQLQRDLRRLTGRAPNDHLRALRMETAHRLLSEGARDTVAEVAAAVGLSPAYFSRIYAVWYGRAPSEDLARHPSR